MVSGGSTKEMKILFNFALVHLQQTHAQECNSQVKSREMTALEPPATIVCQIGWCSGDDMTS